MTTDLLSTSEAALLLGVAPSSVKRWADQGLLPCVRTAGSHRRYDRTALERLVRSQSIAGGQGGSSLDGWIERLVEGRAHETEGALLGERSRLGAWHRVADGLGPVVTEIGRRWESGRLGIAEEHLAAACLARSLARIAEALPRPHDGPNCLLACAEGDEHTLGLSLLEPCVRELGWATVWLGGRTPTREVVRTVDAGWIQLVALSASAASSDETALDAIAEQVGAACRERDVALVLGGSGAWPERPRHGARLRSFSDFHVYVNGLVGVRQGIAP